MLTKPGYLLLTAVLAVSLSGCGNDSTATVEQMEMRGELVYQKGESRPFSGVVTGTYSNGDRESEFRYKDGQRHGVASNFYPNGQERNRVTYVEGVVQGPVVFWHPNGNKMLDATSVNGRAHGLVTEYYENGNRSSETSYVDGFPRGLRKQWFESGEFFQQYNITAGGSGMQFQ